MKITAGLLKFAMKLPNVKSKFGIILGSFLFFTACQSLSKNTHNKLIGTWTYASVSKSDSLVFAVHENDSLVFTSNTFKYDIASVQKHMQGNWQVIRLHSDSVPAAVQLKYLPGQQVRQFEILKINDSSLIIQEKGIIFTFSKRSS
jgi:hypothetical protein